MKFKDATLQEGEFITDFEFRFGTVKADFREVEQPRLYCDMLDNLPNGFIFLNHTKVSLYNLWIKLIISGYVRSESGCCLPVLSLFFLYL